MPEKPGVPVLRASESAGGLGVFGGPTGRLPSILGDNGVEDCRITVSEMEEQRIKTLRVLRDGGAGSDAGSQDQGLQGEK